MYNSMKIDGDQKTLITVIVLFMAFILFLITLPSDNVGVYMHNVSHTWAVVDSNGVSLEDDRGTTIKEEKGYHCVLMERSFGEDNHIESFANDDFDSAKVLYLELRQFDIDNPKRDSGTSGFSISSGAIFLMWFGGLLMGIGATFGLKKYFPEIFESLLKWKLIK